MLFPYNSEFVRNKYRGPFLSLQGLFWMVGRFLCGGLAWILIPMTSIRVSFGSFQFHSWRIFLALSALPSVLGALLYLGMPETPRYLLEAGKERKAIKILRMVHRINHLHRSNVPDYPVRTNTFSLCIYKFNNYRSIYIPYVNNPYSITAREVILHHLGACIALHVLVVTDCVNC